MLHRALDHLVDLLGLAHVELHGERVDAAFAQRGPSVLEILELRLAIAIRAQAIRGRPCGHRGRSRFRRRYHRDLVLQQVCVEHDVRCRSQLRHVGCRRRTWKRSRGCSKPSTKASTSAPLTAPPLTHLGQSPPQTDVRLCRRHARGGRPFEPDRFVDPQARDSLSRGCSLTVR